MPDPHDPTHPPPSTLNYQPPDRQPSLPAPSARQTLFRFFTGLIAGTLLSAIVWGLSFKAEQGAFVGGAMLIVPAAKLAAGIVFLCRPGWRSLGAGILVSLALGLLIFFGVCAMHLGDMH